MNKMKLWFSVLSLAVLFLVPITAHANLLWTTGVVGAAFNGHEQAEEAYAIGGALDAYGYNGGWYASWSYRNSFARFSATGGAYFTLDGVNLGPNITVVHKQDWIGVATNLCASQDASYGWLEGYIVNDSNCTYYATWGRYVRTLGINSPVSAPVVPIISPSVTLTVNGNSNPALSTSIPYGGSITSSYTSQNTTSCMIYDYDYVTGQNTYTLGNIPSNYDLGTTGPYYASFWRYAVCYDMLGTTAESHQLINVASPTVNGVCGLANGVYSAVQPTINLCLSGTGSVIPYLDCATSDYPDQCATLTGSFKSCPYSYWDNYEAMTVTENRICTTDPPNVAWMWACLSTGGGSNAYCSAPSTVTLTITKAGTGSGTVTSSPAGINCGATCNATYSSGTQVALTAAPNAGSTFAGWSGDADCTNGSVTMDASKTCTAAFSPLPTVILQFQQ